MVKRPLAGKRPVGPLMDINMDRPMGDKVQLGVAGTSFPNIRKSPLNVLFVMDKHVATLPKDARTGVLKDKIHDKVDGTPQVDVKRGGSSSKAPFNEQAVIVRFGKGSLPVQESSINRVSNAIERHYSDFGAGVKNIIFDTE